VFPINPVSNTCNKVIEIYMGKILSINYDLDDLENKQLISFLQKYSKAFAWDYIDM
jgi:hypothetical protein